MTFCGRTNGTETFVRERAHCRSLPFGRDDKWRVCFFPGPSDRIGRGRRSLTALPRSFLEVGRVGGWLTLFQSLEHLMREPV